MEKEIQRFSLSLLGDLFPPTQEEENENDYVLR